MNVVLLLKISSTVLQGKRKLCKFHIRLKKKSNALTCIKNIYTVKLYRLIFRSCLKTDFALKITVVPTFYAHS